MPESRDFFDIAALTKAWRKDSEIENRHLDYAVAIELAQAQQLAVISSKLTSIAESLAGLLDAVKAVKRGE